jgi:hypothetical protein
MTDPETGNLPPLETRMLAWAREAGAIARAHYRQTGALRFKHGQQAVTVADV